MRYLRTSQQHPFNYRLIENIEEVERNGAPLKHFKQHRSTLHEISAEWVGHQLLCKYK